MQFPRRLDDPELFSTPSGRVLAVDGPAAFFVYPDNGTVDRPPPESPTGWGSVDFASHECNWLRFGELEGYYSTTVILIG